MVKCICVPAKDLFLTHSTENGAEDALLGCIVLENAMWLRFC